LSLVLDSSMALAWCFADERSYVATEVLQRVSVDGATVPALWHLEIANGLLVAERRGRVSADFRHQTLADLAVLAIHVDAETPRRAWHATSELAERFGLTPYDAAYLELAERTGLPLATRDAALAQAAATLGVAL
jgi:predicted nucleic acid-binding protein